MLKRYGADAKREINFRGEMVYCQYDIITVIVDNSILLREEDCYLMEIKEICVMGTNLKNKINLRGQL